MTPSFEFYLRPGLLVSLLSKVIPFRRKAFLTLAPEGLEVRFPFAFKSEPIPWHLVDLLFSTEKRRSRSIYVEFLEGSPIQYILEEIDDQRPSLEINRELARLRYLRGGATPEELEAARRDEEQS